MKWQTNWQTAADECGQGMQFDQDVSYEFTEPVDDNFWIKQQVVNTEGEVETSDYLRDLNDSLTGALHDKYKLGQSDQQSIYFQSWKRIRLHKLWPLLTRCP